MTDDHCFCRWCGCRVATASCSDTVESLGSPLTRAATIILPLCRVHSVYSGDCSQSRLESPSELMETANLSSLNPREEKERLIRSRLRVCEEDNGPASSGNRSPNRSSVRTHGDDFISLSSGDKSGKHWKPLIST